MHVSVLSLVACPVQVHPNVLEKAKIEWCRIRCTYLPLVNVGYKMVSSLMLDLFTRAASFAFFWVWFFLICLLCSIGAWKLEIMILHHVWWMMVILCGLLLAFMVFMRLNGRDWSRKMMYKFGVSSSWKEVMSDGWYTGRWHEVFERHHRANAQKGIESSIGSIMIHHFEEMTFAEAIFSEARSMYEVWRRRGADYGLKLLQIDLCRRLLSLSLKWSLHHEHASLEIQECILIMWKLSLRE